MKIFGGMMAYCSGSLFGEAFVRAVAYPIKVPGFERFMGSLAFGASALFGYLALIEVIEYMKRR